MIKKWFFAVAFIAALLVWGPPEVSAQVTTGTIVGTVSDSGGVVPGATVTVREVNKGTTNTYVTDATGSYTASFLVPGTYAVEVNVQGFKRSILEGLRRRVECGDTQSGHSGLSVPALLSCCRSTSAPE